MGLYRPRVIYCMDTTCASCCLPHLRCSFHLPLLLFPIPIQPDRDYAATQPYTIRVTLINLFFYLKEYKITM
jgi:hypothetical protein